MSSHFPHILATLISRVLCVFWRGLLKSFPYVCARFARRLFIIYNCHKISVSTAHESHLPPHNIILWFRQKCFFKVSVGRELVVGHNEKYFPFFHCWRVESQFKSIYCWFFSLLSASIECLLLKYGKGFINHNSSSPPRRRNNPETILLEN